jgi:hypothetical protein
MNKIVIIIAVLVIGFIGVGTVVGCYFSYNNKEIKIREKAEAQRGNIEAVHDAMWKIISQKAQVSEKYKESFDSIYTHIIEGRYSQGDGSLMKWITEANPEFDSSLYKDLMDAIEVQRTQFKNEQKTMLDIKREHNTLCKTYPGRWFITNTEEIEYTVISSDKTKDVMATGTDNDVNLF